MARIALVEPYYTGSHRKWARGLQKHSGHEIRLFTMEGRFWKWRMHGGAVWLAHEVREARFEPDMFVVTDMLDLAAFQGMLRREFLHVPYGVYFHENQLTYPVRPGEKRDLHYGWLNYSTMVAADAVYFNSAFHMEAVFDELPRLLKHFPDYGLLDTLDALKQKAEVLWLGMALSRFDAHKPPTPRDGPLRILWNHRWEYDKQPRRFFDALYRLDAHGADFEVIVLGKSYRQKPEEFAEARERLGNKIIQYGFTAAPDDYAKYLWEADVVVSTAIQDFFGGSICEAMACGCVPLLPDRLNYPAFIPEEHRELCLYEDSDGLVERLLWMADHREEIRRLSLRESVMRFDWSRIIGVYDAAFDRLLAGGARP